MRLLSDFHTHTIYSRHNHGKGTIRENVEAALQKGLKELWITDHGPDHFWYGIKRDKFPEVRSQIDELNKEFEGRIKVYFGVEANVISYSGDIDIKAEDRKYLDGVNVGFHYGIIPKNFSTFFYFLVANTMAKVIKPMRNWIKQKNTDALIEAVKKHDIKIVTHPGDKVDVDIYRLARVCETRNTAMEINSSHTNMNEDDIKEALKTDVLISVGSDAHSPRKIGNFEEAYRRISNTNVPIERIINLRE